LRRAAFVIPATVGIHSRGMPIPLVTALIGFHIWNLQRRSMRRPHKNKSPGARPREFPVVEALFAVLMPVPIDAEIGKRAGDDLRLYLRSHSVELGDALIAATASAHKLALWTRNREHYPMDDLSYY
jgi:predicted nucleic acid-binding protein